jgi:biofilm PGA synthesis N-glycosyltransferase PgaC
MVTLFWAGVAWLLYVYAGYPLVLLALSCIRRVRPNTDDSFLPTVSVLISARNEERDIAWKIEETLGWNYFEERVHIYVASDASTDGTDEILDRLAACHPRLHVYHLARWAGKAEALNFLASQADGEILFFTDANAHIEPGFLRLMVRHFADSKVGCVTGETRNWEESGNGMGRASNVYFRYDGLITWLENLLGSALVCNGAVFCIRRELFHPLSSDLANDLETPMRIARLGYWILHEPSVWVSEQETCSLREDIARRRRICGQGALGAWRLHSLMGGLRGWQFVSHKVLRWLSLVPVAMIAISSFGMGWGALAVGLRIGELALLALASVGFAALAMGRPSPPIVSVPLYALAGLVGAFLGVVDAFAGRRFAVWDAAGMSRGDDRSWKREHS